MGTPGSPTAQESLPLTDEKAEAGTGGGPGGRPPPIRETELGCRGPASPWAGPSASLSPRPPPCTGQPGQGKGRARAGQGRGRQGGPEGSVGRGPGALEATPGSGGGGPGSMWLPRVGERPEAYTAAGKGRKGWPEAGGATDCGCAGWLTVEPRGTGCGWTLEQHPIWVGGRRHE